MKKGTVFIKSGERVAASDIWKLTELINCLERMEAKVLTPMLFFYYHVEAYQQLRLPFRIIFKVSWQTKLLQSGSVTGIILSTDFY